MKKISHIALFVFLLYCTQISAQTSNDLSPEELEIFQTEVKNRVKRFQNYITFIGSKKNNIETKNAYIRQTLKLFIGEGEDYKDVHDNIQPAVRMQLSDIRSRVKRWRKTKQYLYNLTKVSYRELYITWADVCRVGEFHKVRDGLYVATVYISQKFEGVKDNYSVVNYDEKAITVYLEEVVTIAGSRYNIFFGDIEVTESY
ncbi:hypothetical protein [uncultured Bacteroides sp.]|uniref:hypothetical protein n=1 Tax=uncultured Bacteroides sp. TaxID=162156 RepID=UPI0023CDE96B|nr:hypothetical protein [uncultured Bacteroides sp.]MDE5701481.1 hypothetical protein [Bacteroides sp.]